MKFHGINFFCMDTPFCSKIIEKSSETGQIFPDIDLYSNIS